MLISYLFIIIYYTEFTVVYAKRVDIKMFVFIVINPDETF